jgi:hypothetical protein
VAYRIRLIEPISADFAVSVGDAIRNLRSSLDQVAYQLAVQHSGPLTEDAERMTELPIRISGAQFDDWATSKNNRRSCAARRDAVGRSQEAERDNDVGFGLNRLWNAYKHRRLPLLAATRAREGGR